MFPGVRWPGEPDQKSTNQMLGFTPCAGWGPIACTILEILCRKKKKKPQLVTKFRILPVYNLLRLSIARFLLLALLFTGSRHRGRSYSQTQNQLALRI